MVHGKTTARMAGALYLMSAVAAGGPILYVSGSLIVDGDAAASVSNILASETLFRACMVSELVGALLLVLLVRTLFRLFASVDRRQATLMVTLVLLSVPITFINVLNEVAALDVARGAGFPAVISKPQRDAWAMLFLDLHGAGVSLANIFWGLWLLPFGVLVLKSGFLPKALGGLLILNCFALVFVSCIALLLPRYVDDVSRMAVIPELGELWVMGWLLIRGASVAPLPGERA